MWSTIIIVIKEFCNYIAELRTIIKCIQIYVFLSNSAPEILYIRLVVHTDANIMTFKAVYPLQTCYWQLSIFNAKIIKYFNLHICSIILGYYNLFYVNLYVKIVKYIYITPLFNTLNIEVLVILLPLHIILKKQKDLTYGTYSLFNS